MPRFLFRLLGNAQSASSRVRGYWIAAEMAEMGYSIETAPRQTQSGLLNILKAGLRADVVVFQKCYARVDVIAAAILRLFGKTIAFDIDDAPSKTGNRRTLKNVRRMMRLSHKVFAGSQALTEFAADAGANVRFVPSGIRLENYTSLKPRGQSGADLCLGWIGNGAQYATDLVSILEGPLKKIARTHSVRLKIVGACGNEAFSDAFSGIDGLQLETVDTLDWSDPCAVSAALQDFDVGLYPLIETPFNKYKCAFKALEYMAFEIPVVASNIGANSDVITHGKDGFLVNSAEEWHDALAALITDAALRKDMGRNGRIKIEQAYNTRTLAQTVAQDLQ